MLPEFILVGTNQNVALTKKTTNSPYPFIPMDLKTKAYMDIPIKHKSKATA